MSTTRTDLLRHFVALLLALAGLLLAASAHAQEKPVRVIWDPPATDQADLISSYNVYRVTVTPALLPADYDVNIPTPVEGTYALAYQKLNTDPIAKDSQEFTIDKATPGMQLVVRAYSATWGGESPDSDILTLRPMPGKVQGLKATALILESSIDLQKWIQRAVYEMAFVAPTETFRLRW